MRMIVNTQLGALQYDGSFDYVKRILRVKELPTEGALISYRRAQSRAPGQK
jgi:hypothetical protein